MKHAPISWCRLRVALVALLPALLLVSPSSRGANQPEQYATVAGPLVLRHDQAMASVLQLPRQQVELPADWRTPAISSSISLANETVLLMSHASAGCTAHTALIVVSAGGVHGPYRLPGCNDMLALQRSDDQQSVSILRLGKTPLQSWTYSSRDQRLQGPGPSSAALPATLRQLAAASATRAPAKPRSVTRKPAATSASRSSTAAVPVPAAAPTLKVAAPAAPTPAASRGRTLNLDLTTDLPETP